MYKLISCNVEHYTIQWYNTLSSTNIKATELALQNAAEGTVIVADYQTDGRGQRDTIWESESEKNLTFTVILRPEFLTVEKQFFLLKAMSLAVCDYLQLLGIDARIKWPNDIYIDDCKVTGMLIEHSIMGENISFSIVGIGLNLNQKTFTSNATNPISVFQKTGKTIDLTEALNQLLVFIDKRYSMLKNDKGQAELNIQYLQHLYRNNDWHWYEDMFGRRFKARITGISNIGELMLEDESCTLSHYSFKEVKFIL